MTTEAQREQAERREVLRNDARVREQTGTYMSHTHDDLAGGRFAATGTPHIIGSTAVPIYPAAPAHQSDPVGLEPPIDEPLEPSPAQGNSAAQCQSDPPAVPLRRGVECGAGPPFFQTALSDGSAT
jgi:hypothetical protein